MAAFDTIILAVAIAWAVWQLWDTRRRVRSGAIVVPLLFAATLVFVLFILLILAIGASPLHLLWLFPLSFVLGVVILVFPAGVKFTMTCLFLLAGIKPHQ